MDIQGYEAIVSALEANFSSPVGIVPWPFNGWRSSSDSSEAAHLAEGADLRYVDLTFSAEGICPAAILNALNKADLMAGADETNINTTRPRLKVLGFTAIEHSNIILSLEDLAAQNS